MNTAVAFIVFNRPDVTARVLAAIREARPPVLLVIADGPRAERPGEAEKCAQVRELVEAGGDWPCDVRRNYSEESPEQPCVINQNHVPICLCVQHSQLR